MDAAGENAEYRRRVRHLIVAQLSSPGMHWAEDDAVLDRSEKLLVRFQQRPETVKIRRPDGQRFSGRAVSIAFRPMAALAMTFIDRFPAHQIRRIVLRRCLERRCERWEHKTAGQSYGNKARTHVLPVAACELLGQGHCSH